MKICKFKIQHLQDRKLWTNKDLAEAAGVSYPTVCSLKSRGSCSTMTAGKLAAALEVEVRDIIPDP